MLCAALFTALLTLGHLLQVLPPDRSGDSAIWSSDPEPVKICAGYPVLLLGSMRVGPTALYAYAADRSPPPLLLLHNPIKWGINGVRGLIDSAGDEKISKKGRRGVHYCRKLPVAANRYTRERILNPRMVQARSRGTCQHALLQGPGREEAVQIPAVCCHLS